MLFPGILAKYGPYLICSAPDLDSHFPCARRCNLCCLLLVADSIGMLHLRPRGGPDPSSIALAPPARRFGSIGNEFLLLGRGMIGTPQRRQALRNLPQAQEDHRQNAQPGDSARISQRRITVIYGSGLTMAPARTTDSIDATKSTGVNRIGREWFGGIFCKRPPGF